MKPVRVLLVLALAAEVSGQVERDQAAIGKALGEEFAQTHPEKLPTGREVSAAVRERLKAVDPVADPDGALVTWMEVEEIAFRQWERRKIERKLETEFRGADGEIDVDEFLRFSMSLRQSRVSRAGGALQYHVAEVLRQNGIEFTAQAKVDDGERPDFLFPSQEAYEDSEFSSSRLRLLGVKNTAKDRWRQVLAEGDRIARKHLLTMEEGISQQQTEIMKKDQLQLVVPVPIQASYLAAQRDYLQSFAEFIAEVKALQR
ncbi:MAG: hypothetical protein ACI8UO_001535 [Verrucomicrobiales bacterium]